VVWFEALVVRVLLEHRPTLANQGVRAPDSVVLNLCEGRTARGKKAANYFDIALGEPDPMALGGSARRLERPPGVGMLRSVALGA